MLSAHAKYSIYKVVIQDQHVEINEHLWLLTWTMLKKSRRRKKDNTKLSDGWVKNNQKINPIIYICISMNYWSMII